MAIIVHHVSIKFLIANIKPATEKDASSALLLMHHIFSICRLQVVKQVAKDMCGGFALLFLLSLIQVKELIVCGRLRAIPLLNVSNNWLDVFIGATLKWSTH